MLSSSAAFCAVMAGCAALREGMNSEYIPPSQRGSGSANAPSGSRRAGRGPGNINDLSAILQRANCPLSDAQIEFLLSLEEGAEFTKRMSEVLDEKQIEAVGNAGGGRRRR
ncbi:hypothetical protein ES708_17052 [subsurface metagenome]